MIEDNSSNILNSNNINTSKGPRDFSRNGDMEYVKKYLDKTKLTKKEKDEVLDSIDSLLERKFSFKNRIRERRWQESRKSSLIINNLEKENFYLKEENKIFVPKPKNKGVNEKEFEFLRKIINEMNITFEGGAYTALSLLFRKIIINLSFVLMAENHPKEYLAKKVTLNNKEVALKRISFERIIYWLFQENYLTKKDRDLLLSMKKKSNQINHEIEISETKEEAAKFYSTIKGLIASNFDSVGSFETKKNERKMSIKEFMLSQNILENDDDDDEAIDKMIDKYLIYKDDKK